MATDPGFPNLSTTMKILLFCYIDRSIALRGAGKQDIGSFNGFYGGILLLWRDDLDTSLSTPQHIEVFVKRIADEDWMFTALYFMRSAS